MPKDPFYEIPTFILKQDIEIRGIDECGTRWSKKTFILTAENWNKLVFILLSSPQVNFKFSEKAT